jgi:hypothetical protein
VCNGDACLPFKNAVAKAARIGTNGRIHPP